MGRKKKTHGLAIGSPEPEQSCESSRSASEHGKLKGNEGGNGTMTLGNEVGDLATSDALGDQ